MSGRFNEDSNLILSGTAPVMVTPTRGNGRVIGLGAATTTTPGSMSAADKAKLDEMQRPILRLQYIASTDIANGSALAAGTWTTIGPIQPFTWGAATATGLAWARGNIFGGATTAIVASRLLFDTGQTVMLGGGYCPNTATSAFTNFLGGAGPVYLSLAAGARTVQLQVISGAAGVAYCRAASNPGYEGLTLTVVEWAP